MTTAVQTQSEYRNLPLVSLTESATNPRRSFDQSALGELAESIKTQGILAPLVVRPVGQHFEIVAGARRYRAAQLAGLETAPVRIVELTDAQALETSIVENLQRRDVHPLDEANGFAALMGLEEPKYSIEQIAAKVGKAPAFILARLKLVELVPAVVEAFSQDEIGLGHALLLAKLQPAQQEEALAACYQEQYTNGSKVKRILLPVRHLQQWIEHNILLELASAPFSKENAALVPEAGACLDCSKRTGHNVLLFEGLSHAQRWEWTTSNPITHVRQSAKRSRVPTVLNPDELKGFLANLVDPAKTAVLLGALTGLRVGELLGLKWSDIDFEKLEISVIRDVVKQRIERCKTEASKKAIPIDAELAESLWSWRLRCAYNQQDDWVFASPHGKGKQPYWPSSLYRVYLKPALEVAGITEPVGWHTLRHSFGTLMKANGEDIKTIQELLRHANFKVTMDVYTQAVTDVKRTAHSRVARQIMGEKKEDEDEA